MTNPPGFVADRPVSEDLLSALLDSVHLRGERLAAYAPETASSIAFAGSGALHIVEQGSVRLSLDVGEEATRLERGDAVLLPRGDRHTVSNAQPAGWLSGTFTIGDPHASHLLGRLPAMITLRGARGQALEWFEVSRRMLLLEMQAPTQGSTVMIARILDLLFINALRHWAARDDAAPTWLTGAMDAQIGTALAIIHSDPARPWTVEGLARACILSRSAFAARFAERVGMPPAAYLAEVRLEAAADLLRATPEPVAAVAARVGYASEAAFSRAFSKRHGVPPARWRREARVS